MIEMIDVMQNTLLKKKQATLYQVAGLRISTKNVGDLCECPVVLRGMPHHVARDKANAAAMDPVYHPNHRDCCLLFPLHHQLHLTESQHHILLQHLAVHLVLLA